MTLFALLLAAAYSPTPPSEVVVRLPHSAGAVALSTRGATAFRVRLLPHGDGAPIDTPMVAPDAPDAAFEKIASSAGTGIKVAGLGSVLVSPAGALSLLDASGATITYSDPLGTNSSLCATQPATDVTSGTRAGDPATVADEAACCALCKQRSGCTNWIYGHPGDEEGNCWPMASIGPTTSSPTRTLGGKGGGTGVRLSTSAGALLYGSGSGKDDAAQLTAKSATPYVDNTVVYAPHYFSTDGYAVLAVVNTTTGSGKTNLFPANFASDGAHVSWSFPACAPFELPLMPAATLDAGTTAYLRLTGPPAVPPRFAFGFIASRWGWSNRSYIEQTLHAFRDGGYPIDAMIGDFGWFTNVSDYPFSPQGESWYQDFGYNADTFPSPAEQLASYRKDLHIRMGGIRKPRLGNTALLDEARTKGFLLPGGELRDAGRHPLGYAEQRNINYSLPAAREWYATHQKHYLDDGVAFFWNDEGETDYFTFHEWNLAQAQTLANVDPTRRFYSINRAWSPGMARLGATVWTGDIHPTWDDLAITPGTMLKWILGGAPYVACDIGGFTGETTAPLLARWMQLGAFMPTMRVHSTHTATPHFPFLWPEPYQSHMKAALEMRYQLLPYHYSLAHRMFSEGRMWIRPLAAAFPGDAVAATLASQFLDGDLLVAPVLREDSSFSAYLPAGTWFRVATATHVKQTTVVGPTWVNGTAAEDEVPIWAPAGAVVPFAPVLQHTDALPGGPLEILVYGGADGAFVLVEDDGETTAYAGGQGARRTSLAWDDGAAKLTWTCKGAAAAGAFTKLSVTLALAGGVERKSAVVEIGDGGKVVVPP